MTQSNFWKRTGLGQLFMVGIPGTELDSKTIDLIRDFGISRFIIFARNAKKGPESLRNLCLDIKNLCRQEGLTPLLAVDQEGGPVRRLKPPLFPDMPCQEEVRKSQDPQLKVLELAEATAKILKGVCLDLNLAPVLDIQKEGASDVLKGRCLGKTPQEVASAGSAYIRRMKELGIMTCAKHFPGIGRVELDPHHHLPRVDAPRELIFQELSPFRDAISCGTNFIMTSHVIFSDIDEDDPATFSRKIAIDLLRQQLHFDGPLLTDDLEMKGALKNLDVPEAALEAFVCGHDLLLICESQDKVAASLELFKKSFQKGRLTKSRIEEAIYRIGRVELANLPT
ncbi:MAG: glycoside hydrolase family 3 protein [Thermodesulfobacteria bacterium]|nr:glycoside hydrolase family 3 protein [Thermodesulfobacteriota bacterium]